MKRVQHKLSARQVETLKRPGRHSDGGNLFLSISNEGGRRWVFLYRWQGKRVEMGLGSAAKGGVSLADARDLARKARNHLDNNIDPLGARRAALESGANAKAEATARQVTFGQLADEHIEAMQSAWSNPRHAAQWKYTLGTLAAPLRAKPIADIDTEVVLSVLKPLWTKTPETAGRLRGRIEAVLNRAKAKGLRNGQNPAAWRGHLQLLLPKRLTRGHHAALPYDQIADFMADLRQRDALSSTALEFCILTAARTNEVCKAQWAEVDWNKAVWTIPAGRMKAKTEHRVPLSDRALELLRKLKTVQSAKYVFPGLSQNKTMSAATMGALLGRINPNITVHGFRSAFRDWAAETTSFPHDVCKMALAHTIENKAESAYRRGDMLAKRTKLMEAWADYCEPKAVGKIIPLSRGTMR